MIKCSNCKCVIDLRAVYGPFPHRGLSSSFAHIFSEFYLFRSDFIAVRKRLEVITPVV